MEYICCCIYAEYLQELYIILLMEQVYGQFSKEQLIAKLMASER